MSSPSVDDAAPRVLGDRYRLERLIATGGMAAVWRAHDEVLARTVAVKLLHDHLAVDDEFRERFRREAIAAAKLSHPHIVGLYDTGSEGRQAWLIMEFVDGATLRHEMDDTAPLDVARVAAIGEHVARALGYAHGHGLVHRDVKPANILLGHDGSVKVADFGIAKVAGAADDLTGTGAVLGTAAYVAPEQILDEPLDGACDQYALGCVLYEALTGQRPFQGDSAVAIAAQRLQRAPRPPRELRPDLPAGLETVIERTLARHTSDRYPSADDLADALARFTDREPVAAATPDPRRPPATRPAAQRAPTGLGAPATRGAPAGGRNATAAPPSPAPPAPPAPNRRRRVTPIVASVALAAVLLALVSAGVFRGPDGLFDTNEEDGRAAGDTGAVAPTDITLFDPGGTGSEDSADLPSLLDGDPATTWRTVGYNTPDFGNLKAGLGFWLDLGSPHLVDTVELHTETPGIAYEIRRADQPATALDGWQVVASAADLQEDAAVPVAAQTGTRYLLVWITGDLQPDGDGRYRAELTDVVVRGRPE